MFRWMALLPLLACSPVDHAPDIGMVGGSDTDGSFVQQCLSLDRNTLTFDGTLAPDERDPGLLVITSIEDCGLRVSGLRLDDPDGAFTVVGDVPADLFLGETLEIEVWFEADAPGGYEAQLLVDVEGADGAFAVQLYGEVPE